VEVLVEDDRLAGLPPPPNAVEFPRAADGREEENRKT